MQQSDKDKLVKKEAKKQDSTKSITKKKKATSLKKHERKDPADEPISEKPTKISSEATQDAVEDGTAEK